MHARTRLECIHIQVRLRNIVPVLAVLQALAMLAASKDALARSTFGARSVVESDPDRVGDSQVCVYIHTDVDIYVHIYIYMCTYIDRLIDR